MKARIQIETTGKTQGPFHGDADPKGTPGPSRVVDVEWSAEKRSDHGRQGHTNAVATANSPIEVVKEWGPSTPQYWTASWSNEVLSTVTITTFDPDDAGGTKAIQVLTLTNATVVSLRSRTTELGREEAGAEIGEPIRKRDYIKFAFESLTVEHPVAQTKAVFKGAGSGVLGDLDSLAGSASGKLGR